MISIKDFAIKNKVSESIVYRHIRNHKDDLGDRVQKAHGRTWLTPEGESFIKNLMTQQTVIYEKASDEMNSLMRILAEKEATIEALTSERDALKTQIDIKVQALEEHANSLAALEAQNGDLRADKEKLGQKVAQAEKMAENANKEAWHHYRVALEIYNALPWWKKRRRSAPVPPGEKE